MSDRGVQSYSTCELARGGSSLAALTHQCEPSSLSVDGCLQNPRVTLGGSPTTGSLGVRHLTSSAPPASLLCTAYPQAHHCPKAECAEVNPCCGCTPARTNLPIVWELPNCSGAVQLRQARFPATCTHLGHACPPLSDHPLQQRPHHSLHALTGLLHHDRPHATARRGCGCGHGNTAQQAGSVATTKDLTGRSVGEGKFVTANSRQIGKAYLAWDSWVMPQERLTDVTH